MTIVAYHNGILGADKRSITEETVANSERVNTVTKVFKSSCNRFAVGIIGAGRRPEEIPRIMDYLSSVVFQYILHEKDTNVLTDKEYNFLGLGNTHYLVVTSNELFLFNESGSKTYTGSIFMGSGGNVARAAIECGKSMEEAIELAAKLITSVGNGVDIVDCRSLEPIVIKEEVANV